MTSRYFAAFCLRSPDAPGTAVLSSPQSDGIVPSRFGFTLPRALGKAVYRNRMKRRMREAVRTQLKTVPPSWAIVFNPRRSVLDAPFEDLCREVGRVFARCKES